MKTSRPLIVIYVHDMARARRFYGEVLGFTVDSESPGWSVLSCHGVLVGLHVLYPSAPESTVPHAGLNLLVDDLDAAISEVERGGGRLKELRDGFELRQQVV